MVRQADFHGRESPPKHFCLVNIRLPGARGARRVVVHENDIGTLFLDGLPEDTGGIDGGALQGPGGNHFPANQKVGPVQVQDPALLVIQVLQLRQHELIDHLRRGDGPLVHNDLFFESTSPQFQGGGDGDSAGFSHALVAYQFFQGHDSQQAQPPTGTDHQFLCDVNDTQAAGPASQQDGQ